MSAAKRSIGEFVGRLDVPLGSPADVFHFRHGPQLRVPAFLQLCLGDSQFGAESLGLALGRRLVGLGRAAIAARNRVRWVRTHG